MLRRSTSCLHAASTMLPKATSSPSPKKHNFLPFKDKLDLIRKCEEGIAHSVVAAEMGVPRSTVSTIWKNRDKYCETSASPPNWQRQNARGTFILGDPEEEREK
ncbi:hypothetical protein E2C01_012694 [Portunus trituberculatus]|uniref:HTH psq-type domain-containing protein n=1 Tax=Portunus trituberculatus TaxID=210409 RepID=A0A5B7DF37_PORTR|nr:hypothetical protein [Portunus trituberculatus]